MSYWSLLILTLVAQRPASAKPVGPPGHTAGSSAGPVTAFVNVSVIPMDREQVLPNQTVVVQGEEIAQIGPAGQVSVPAGAVRIDGRGQFLLPGLGDLHVHLFPDLHADDWTESRPVAPTLFCYLANGVTTIRLADRDTFFLGLRAQVASGTLLGPRLYLTTSWELGQRNAAESLAARRAAGYDVVALWGWDREWGQTQDWNHDASFDSVVAAVHQAGLALTGATGELSTAVGLQHVLQARFTLLLHLEGYLEALLGRERPRGGDSPAPVVWDSLLRATATPPPAEAQLAALAVATQQAGVWTLPTLTETEQMLARWAGPAGRTPSPLLSLQGRLVRALRDAGAGLVLGTGAPAWGMRHGFAVHQELERLVAAGLTPYQALKAGTRQVAAALGTLDHAGTVAVGKWADLVLLAENPLVDIRRTAQPVGVMSRGRWLARAAIKQQLDVPACASGRR